MLEFAQMTVSEPPARVLGKWERRALLTYFVFTPPEEEEAVTTMGEGIRAEGGGKQGGGGHRSNPPPTPPPPYDVNLSMGTGGGRSGVGGGLMVICNEEVRIFSRVRALNWPRWVLAFKTVVF